MTDIEFEGKRVSKLEVHRLGESLVGFKLTLEKSGKIEWVGYFREET